MLDTDKAREITDKLVTDYIDKFDHGWWTSALASDTEVGMHEVFDEEIEAATADPAFRNAVRVRALAALGRQSALTAEAAVTQALKQVAGNSSFVMGKMVMTYRTPLKEAMGLQDHTNRMTEHDAVMSYLKTFGGKDAFWGTEWNEKGNWLEYGSLAGIPVPKGVRLGEKIRGVPQCSVNYNWATQLFTIAPYRDDGTLGPSKSIPAKEIGDWYRAYHKQRLDKRHTLDGNIGPVPVEAVPGLEIRNGAERTG